MDIMKKRWIILAASCMATLCIGSIYAWSAFSSPMVEYLSERTGREITSLAVIYSVANAIAPVTLIGGGYFNDKIGTKGVLIAGALVFGLGMITSGFATSVGMLMVTYGLGLGLGQGLVYGVAVTNTVKFFPDKSGFAGGLVTACYGASSIIVPPIASMLAQTYHVTTAFKVIGGAMLVVLFIAAFIIKPCPKDFSVEAGSQGTDGRADSMEQEKTREPDETRSEESQEKAAGIHSFTPAQMLRQPAFYLMLLIMMCGAFSGMMVISQASQIAQEMMDMSVSAAALTVSMIAVFNMLGRLASGILSDKIGAIGTLFITFAASIIAGVSMFAFGAGSAAAFCVCLMIIGFGFGSVMGIYPGFTIRKFGPKHNGVNYGIMYIGFSLAGILGPTIMTKLHESTGQYQPAFLTAAALVLVGELLLLVLHFLQRKQSW